MSRKIILIKQELLLLVYELNRSGLLAENEKIRPILAQLDRKSGSAGMPRPISYAVFCLKKKKKRKELHGEAIVCREEGKLKLCMIRDKHCLMTIIVGTWIA